MGLIHSIFCACIFYFERVMTWTLCAAKLVMLLAVVLFVMFHAMSVGKLLADKDSRNSSTSLKYRVSTLRSVPIGPDLPGLRKRTFKHSDLDNLPLDIEKNQQSKSANFANNGDTRKWHIISRDRPSDEPSLSSIENEVARRLSGRYRRSRDDPVSIKPYLSLLRAVNVTTMSPVIT